MYLIEGGEENVVVKSGVNSHEMSLAYCVFISSGFVMVLVLLMPISDVNYLRSRRKRFDRPIANIIFQISSHLVLFML